MGFKFLPNGCSWYETNRLGGCVRRPARRECALPDGAARARHSLAVIIPYRAAAWGGEARLPAMKQLCRRLAEQLARHEELDYRIFVSNQTDQHPFNRGALVNAAVGALRRRHEWSEFDFLAIHDVDRFPAQTNDSACARASYDYYTFPPAEPRALNPSSFAGGVLVINTHLFSAVNGFSNQFWGWGEEDNDLFIRLRWCGLPPKHGDELERCMEHRDCAACKQQKRELNQSALRSHEARLRARLSHPRPFMLQDGLSTLNSTVNSVHSRLCSKTKVTVLQVNLAPHWRAQRLAREGRSYSIGKKKT
ncbi:hypothetical protein AB1Y20_007033 [Prymnesium parvum]|uniref:Beta-1,4-galactosyltransferase 7 n=1 Tax=Prymnesium parvum TaxID=97485 RepID=A0AB34J1E2_PRYPA